MKVFLQKSKELFDRIGGHAIMCLATSQENNVTARSMSVIIVERKFYFQTDRNLHKYQQITANPNVALCYNNIQIEGVCKALGHPLLAENAFFAERYRQRYKGSFDKYSSLRNEVLFEVKPIKIAVWDYKDGKPYQEFYDFQNETYCKKEYAI